MTISAGALALCAVAYAWGRSDGSKSAASHTAPPMTAQRATPLAGRDASLQPRAASARPRQKPPPPAAILRPPPAPLHTSETIRATADAFPDLLAAWDPGVAEDLFGDADLQALEGKLAWMNERVGRCDSATPMTSGSASSGRFSYVCERGVVEAGFMVADPEDDSVTKMRAGVRDLEPPPEVSAAAEGVTDLIESWDDEAFEERFADGFRDELGANMPNFTKGLREELGACSVGPVDLASQHGALFVLDCELGRRTMVVSLDEQGLIRALRVVPLRRDPSAPE